MVRGGYAWWYVDALSDDGRDALTVIALVGNVFSPWYWRARRGGDADPWHHCALNVALYRDGAKRWAMTERGRTRVDAGPAHLAIGKSALAWDGRSLTIDVDEVAVPLPRRLVGRIVVHPLALPATAVALDAAGRHRWQPIAPHARVEVAFAAPGRTWRGDAYVDHNEGDAPLEDAFSGWHWSRMRRGRDTFVQYDAQTRDGVVVPLALAIDRRGEVAPRTPGAAVALPRSAWGIARAAQAGEGGAPPRLVRTVEDTPFYARALIEGQVPGGSAAGFHETLSLDRFRAAWVRRLLPFRMPRRAG